MKLRKIALTLVVLLAAVSLFAAEVSVTWEWEKNDADVAYFRYQIGGESPENWTVVPADVTAYTADGLDGSVGYTLYLQQSYDGEYWSVSATAASDPVVPAKSEFVEPAAVEEEAPAAVVEETPVEEVVVEEPVAVVEVAPIEPVAEVKKPSSFQFTTDLGVGAAYGADNVKKTIRTNLSFDFENIVKTGPVGFDIRTDFGFDVANRIPVGAFIDNFSNFLKLESYAWTAYGDLEVGMNASFGKFMMYGAVGARLQANFQGYDTANAFYTFNDNVALKWGVTADLGLRFNLTDVLGFGAEESYTYLFDKSDRHIFATNVYASLTF